MSIYNIGGPDVHLDSESAEKRLRGRKEYVSKKVTEDNSPVRYDDLMERASAFLRMACGGKVPEGLDLTINKHGREPEC